MKKEKILGLDIGVTSLGWAVGTYTYNEQGEKDGEKPNLEIDDFGVRIWESPEDSKTLDSNAFQRRGFRSQRRLISRKKQRINDLKRIFYRNHLLVKEEFETHILKTKERGEYSSREDINPLLLRYKGLSEKLTNLQLLIALINIAKRRGYNNAFVIPNSTQDKDDREQLKRADELINKYKFPIVAIIESDFFNFKDPSKFMYRSKKIDSDIEKKKEKTKIEQEQMKFYNEHQILFNRKDYQLEFDALFNKQIEFNSELVNLKEDIKETIFRQRFFEDGPGPKDAELLKEWKERMRNDSKQFLYEPFTAMIGKCQFYPSEKRITTFSIEGDISFILNEISKIFARLIEKEKMPKYLIGLITKEVITEYLKTFEFKRDFLVNVLKENDLSAPEMNGVSFANSGLFLNKFNSIKENSSFLIKNIKKIDLNDPNTIWENKINNVGKSLSEIKTPAKLKDSLAKIDSLFMDNVDGYDWMRKNEKWIKKGHKTLNTSSKYILKALEKQLNEGLIISKFAEQLNEKNNEEKINNFKLVKEEFLRKIKDPDMVKNAVVFRSINQTRIVVKKLFEKFDRFDKVIIEVAKDLYAEEKVRKSIRSDQDKNEKRRKEAEEILIKNGINPTQTNISNYLLFKSQQITADSKKNDYAIDLYDVDLKNKINLKDFFNNREGYDVDHIVPYSLINDNTNNNKSITTKENNNLKSTLTPLDYFNRNGATVKQISKWKSEITKAFKSNLWKLEILLRENMTRSVEAGFETRDINDTRYITKYIKNYFDLEFTRFEKITNETKPEILTIQGGITSKFRKMWLKPYQENGSLWGHESKPRDISPFHHAVDAMVLLNMISKQHIEFYQSIVRIFNYYNWIIEQKKKGTQEINLINEIDEQRKIIIKQLREQKFQKKYKSDFFEFIVNSLSNQLIDYFKYTNNKLIKLSIFNNKFAGEYVKPLIQNFPQKVNSLIPIKLKPGRETKEIKQIDLESGEIIIKKVPQDIPKFENIIEIKEWAKINNKNERDYPFVSYKINKRVRGNFLGSENPLKHKDAYENGKLKRGFMKDKKENVWDIRSYYGISWNENQKMIPFFQYNVQEARKENYKKILLNKNTTFILNESKILKYNSLGDRAETLYATHPNLYYGNRKKFANMFNWWPDYRLNKIDKIEILNIDNLGKAL